MIKGRYFLVAGKYGIIRSYGMVESIVVREVFRVSGVSFLSLKLEGLEHLRELDLPVIFVCNP